MHFFITFRFGVDFVGLTEALPDSSYTANAQNVAWYPHFVRLDGTTRQWVGGTSLSGSWLRVDLLDVYTIIGLVMTKPRIPKQYVTVFDLKVSVDDVNYQYIDQNIVLAYLPNEDYTTYWFEDAAEARYWMVEPIEIFGTRPSLKGDVIGVYLN